MSGLKIVDECELVNGEHYLVKSIHYGWYIAEYKFHDKYSEFINKDDKGQIETGRSIEEIFDFSKSIDALRLLNNLNALLK